MYIVNWTDMNKPVGIGWVHSTGLGLGTTICTQQKTHTCQAYPYLFRLKSKCTQLGNHAASELNLLYNYIVNIVMFCEPS